MHAEAGRLDVARLAMQQASGPVVDALAHSPSWIVDAASPHEVCARLGDRDQATVLLALLTPYEEQFADRPTWSGSVAYACGLLAGTLQRWDDADRLLGAAEMLAHRRLGAYRCWPPASSTTPSCS